MRSSGGSFTRARKISYKQRRSAWATTTEIDFPFIFVLTNFVYMHDGSKKKRETRSGGPLWSECPLRTQTQTFRASRGYPSFLRGLDNPINKSLNHDKQKSCVSGDTGHSSFNWQNVTLDLTSICPHQWLYYNQKQLKVQKKDTTAKHRCVSSQTSS